MIFVICLLIIDGIYRRYLPSTHTGIEHSSRVLDAIYVVLVTGIIGRIVIFNQVHMHLHLYQTTDDIGNCIGDIDTVVFAGLFTLFNLQAVCA